MRNAPQNLPANPKKVPQNLWEPGPVIWGPASFPSKEKWALSPGRTLRLFKVFPMTALGNLKGGCRLHFGVRAFRVVTLQSLFRGEWEEESRAQAPKVWKTSRKSSKILSLVFLGWEGPPSVFSSFSLYRVRVAFLRNPWSSLPCWFCLGQIKKILRKSKGVSSEANTWQGREVRVPVPSPPEKSDGETIAGTNDFADFSRNIMWTRKQF